MKFLRLAIEITLDVTLITIIVLMVLRAPRPSRDPLVARHDPARCGVCSNPANPRILE